MKIAVISDTHGVDFTGMVPECDLLLHCGDISPVQDSHTFGSQKNWFQVKFIPQLEKLLKEKVKRIAFIGGNHDTFLSEMELRGNTAEVRAMLPSGVHYLCNDSVVIDGVNIFGTPYVSLPKWARGKGPPVWNFAADESELMEIYAAMPLDTDILVSHGPVKGYSDKILDPSLIDIGGVSEDSKHLGSSALFTWVTQTSCKLVVHGHIHSASHDFQHRCDPNTLKICTKFVCTSVLNEQYTVGYKPLVVDWEKYKESLS